MKRAYRHSGITELTKAAWNRKRDAKSLLDRGKHHTRGAMYLAGYAIECKIKAKAMERHRCRTLKDLCHKLLLTEDRVFSHGIESLLKDLLPGGIFARLLGGEAAPAFRAQVNRWTPQWRYDPRNPGEEEANRFMEAVDDVWLWLERNA